MPSEHPISVEQAQTLLEQGHVYLDVRSDLEFEQGHIPGAFNVPLMQPYYDELIPNPDFLPVMTAAFNKGTALIVGCHSGNRSHRAATLLREAGYQRVVELSVGWDGSRDAFGRLSPGWSRLGLPVEHGTGGANSYAVLKQRLPNQ